MSALAGMVYSSSIAIPCWVLLPRLFYDIDESRLRARMGLALGLMAALATGGSFVATIILHAAGLYANAGFWSAWRDALRVCLLITLTFGAVILAVNVLQTRLSEAREELHNRQVAEERERKMAAEARYVSLNPACTRTSSSIH